MSKILLCIVLAAVIGCAHTHTNSSAQSDNPEVKKLKKDIAILQDEELVYTSLIERLKHSAIPSSDSEKQARLQKDILEKRIEFLKSELELYHSFLQGPY